MEDKKPLLSICIPTYNRADVLNLTLKSIVMNKAFDKDVELVISDNCSTDNTKIVVDEFSKNYHNIKYYCNEKNIKDDNFYYGLKRCTGKYIKLQNDYLGFTEEGLFLLKENLLRFFKKTIFFSGNMIYTKKKKEIIECNNLDDYISAVSTFVTWISIFGTWSDEFSLVREPLKYTEKSLNHVDWTYQIVSKNKHCVIIDADIYKTSCAALGKRSGYNYFGVHVENYYNIMEQYKYFISSNTLYHDKKYCLLHFRKEIIYTFIYRPSLWQFDTKNSLKILFHHFNRIPEFYAFVLLYPVCWLLKPLFVVVFGDNIFNDLLRKLYRRYIKKYFVK